MELKKIRTLKDLHQARQLLELESGICRRELGRELKTGKSRIQSLLLTRLGIPLAVIASINFFRSSDKEKQSAARAQAGTKEKSWWSQVGVMILPQLIDLASHWLDKQFASDEAEAKQEDTEATQ